MIFRWSTWLSISCLDQTIYEIPPRFNFIDWLLSVSGSQPSFWSSFRKLSQLASERVMKINPPSFCSDLWQAADSHFAVRVAVHRALTAWVNHYITKRFVSHSCVSGYNPDSPVHDSSYRTQAVLNSWYQLAASPQILRTSHCVLIDRGMGYMCYETEKYPTLERQIWACFPY